MNLPSFPRLARFREYLATHPRIVWFRDYLDAHPKIRVAYATLFILAYLTGIFLTGQYVTVMVGWYLGNLCFFVIFYPAGFLGGFIILDRARPKTPKFLKRFYKFNRTKKVLVVLTLGVLILGTAGGMFQLASGLEQTINPVDRNLIWGSEPEGWDTSYFLTDDGNVYKIYRNPVAQPDEEEGINAAAYDVVTGAWIYGTLPDLWTYNDVYMMFTAANNSIGGANTYWYPNSYTLIYGTNLLGDETSLTSDDDSYHRITEEDNGTAYSENFYYTATVGADADDGVPDSNAETDTGGAASNTYTNASANADLNDAIYDTWTENQTDFSNFETVPDYKVTGIPAETEYNLTIDAYITGDSETINVRIWDYNTLGWDVLGTLVNDTVTEYTLTPADHISGGEANMSFIDTASDAIVTSLYVDFVRIDGHTDAVPYQFSPLPDYEVDLAADETYHFLEIDYVVSGDAENIDVEIYNWTSISWFDAGDINSGTSTPFNYTISAANGLLNGSRGCTVRFNDQDADASQTTLNIDYVRIHAYTPAQTDYSLATVSDGHYPDYQVTGLPVGFDWYELQVEYRTTNLPSENIYVQVWDDPTNTTRGTITVDETAVFEYNLTANERLGNDVIIRFVDSDQSTDSVQTTLEIDYVRVYAYQAPTWTEDPVDNDSSNDDGVADRGTLTDFVNMQTYGTTYATISETNYGGDGVNIEDFIDNDSSNVGDPTDLGTLTDFTNMQTFGTSYTTLTESDEGTAGTNTENNVDNDTSDVDTSADVGTEGTFSNAQSDPTGTSLTLTEDNQGGAGTDEWLENDGDAGTLNDASYSGSSVYLAAVDTNNYLTIEKGGGDASWFTFDNTVGGTGTYTVNVSVYFISGDGGDDLNWGVDTNNDGVSDYTGQIANPVSGWYTDSVGSLSQTEVNNARLFIEGIAQAAYTDPDIDACRLGVNLAGGDDYELAVEYQWTTLSPLDDTNEEICVYINTAFPTENLVLQIWTGSWQTIDTIDSAGAWHNTSITTYLDNAQETIRFIGADEASETTQDTWNIGYIGIHTWTDAVVNYRLDQEVQFTTISDTDNTNEYLCIFMNSTGVENLEVDIWDGTWINIASDLTADAWNNISISAYLDAATETIRFVDDTIAGDTTTQDVWQPNAVLIHTWNADPDWEANQEVQFTGVSYSDDTERICIYVNSTDAEDLGVSIWNASWYPLWTDLTADSWNNVTVYNTITTATVTLRFLAGTETGDPTQSSWQINFAVIQTENASADQTDYTAEGDAVSDNNVWDSYSESRTARVDSYAYTPEGNAAADDAVTDDYQESGSAVSDTSTYTAEGNAVSDNAVYDQFDEDVAEWDFDFPPVYVISSIPAETTYNVSIDWDDAVWGDTEMFYLQLWNFTNTAWTTIAQFDNTNSTPFLYESIDAKFISGGEVRVKIIDSALDTSQTTVKIDQVQVQGHTDAGIKYELTPIPSYEVDGSTGHTNYNATIELRWTTAGGEDLAINMWNFTSAAWEEQYTTQSATYVKFNVSISLSNGLMNATYDCRVQVDDSDKTISDTTQSTADVDFVRIAGWTDAVVDYELSMFYTITIAATNFDWYYLNISAKRDAGGDNFDVKADGLTVGTINSDTEQYFDINVTTVATDGVIYLEVNDTISDDVTNQSVYFDWVRVWGHNDTVYDYDMEIVFEFDSAQSEGDIVDIAIEDESNSTGGNSIDVEIRNDTGSTWHNIWTVTSETETQHTWNTGAGDTPADILNTSSGFDMRYVYSDMTSLVNLTIDRLNASITYSVPDEYRLQVELNFTFAPAFGDITSFNVTDRSLVAAGSVSVQVKNMTGGEWDNVFSVAEQVETTHSTDMGADADHYVHANNNITLRYLGSQGSSDYGNLTIDLLQITIQYTASDADPPSIVLDSPVNNTWELCNQVNLTISDVSGVSKAFYKWGSWSEVWGLWVELTAPWDIDTSTFEDGTYTLQVIANDTIPNPANIFDNNQTYIIKIDNTVPDHGLVTPSNNSVVGGTIPWDFDPVDGTGSGIDWMAVDDGVSNTTLTSPLFTNNMDTSGYSEGTKDFTIYLNDTAGNWNLTMIRLTIDHSPPFLVTDFPNNLTYIGGVNQEFRWDYDDTYATIDELWENWEDGSNTTRADDVAWYEDIDTLYPDVEGDPHWKMIFVNDTSGNDGSANYTYYVDSLAPRIEQLSPANGTTHSGTIWLNASLSETNILLNYTRIWGAGYDQTFNVLNYSLDTTLLGDGWYQWKAYCSDDFGHSNSSTRWIKVDNLNPVPDISAHAYSDPFIYENVRQIITLTVTVDDGDETDIDEVWVYWTTNDWISNNTIIATQGEDSDTTTFFAEISGHDAGITCYWFAYTNNTVGDQDDRYPTENYQSFSWDVETPDGGAGGSPILYWFEPDDQGLSLIFWYFIFILFMIIVLILYLNRKKKKVVT